MLNSIDGRQIGLDLLQPVRLGPLAQRRLLQSSLHTVEDRDQTDLVLHIHTHINAIADEWKQS